MRYGKKSNYRKNWNLIEKKIEQRLLIEISSELTLEKTQYGWNQGKLHLGTSKCLSIYPNKNKGISEETLILQDGIARAFEVDNSFSQQGIVDVLSAKNVTALFFTVCRTLKKMDITINVLTIAPEVGNSLKKSSRNIIMLVIWQNKNRKVGMLGWSRIQSA